MCVTAQLWQLALWSHMTEPSVHKCRSSFTHTHLTSYSWSARKMHSKLTKSWKAFRTIPYGLHGDYDSGGQMVGWKETGREREKCSETWESMGEELYGTWNMIGQGREGLSVMRCGCCCPSLATDRCTGRVSSYNFRTVSHGPSSTRLWALWEVLRSPAGHTILCLKTILTYR